MLVFLYITIWLVFVLALTAKPCILLRPSVWFAVAMMVFVNGAATFLPDGFAYTNGPPFGRLGNLEALRYGSVAFPAAVLFIAFLTPSLSREAASIFRKTRLTVRLPAPWVYRRTEKYLLYALLIAGTVMVLLYLRMVPLRKTGLWTMFFDPEHASLARAQSLKTLTASYIRYGYSWHRALIAPLCAVLLWLSIRRKRPAMAVLKILAIGLLILSVMLTGARSPAAMMLVVIAISVFLTQGFRFGFLAFGGALGATAAVTAFLSISREGILSRFSLAMMREYLGNGIFSRFFVAPFTTGVYTHLYLQDIESPGIASIRPLAVLLGKTYRDLPNLAGRFAFPENPSYISMGTSFLFDFQASFGLFHGFLVSVVCLLALDGLMICYRRLNGTALTAFYALQLLTVLSLLSSAYTVCLNTHGILWIALMAHASGLLLNWQVPAPSLPSAPDSRTSFPLAVPP